MKIDRSRFNVTVDELKHWVEYNPETGEMFRIRGIYPKTGVEFVKRELVTSRNNRGYLWLKVFGKMYLVHRLVFLYMTGSHPEGEVDHIDGDRLNNRWANLRDCDAFANSRNQGIRKDCTSGTRGVNYHSAGRGLKRWIARISHRGVRYHLGYYMTKEEAIAVRKDAESRLGYHPNHARRESWAK